jgi:dihydroorotate dehydrogenase electron transfer subunit
MAHNLVAPIEALKNLGAGYFLLAVHSPEVAREATPASFVMIGLPEIDAMLLRRPFSVARVQGETIEILFKVVGRGTATFSRLEAGDRLSLLGPLGRGFRIDDDPEREHLLVAGGIGNAPFPLLVQELLRRGRPSRLFFGGRSAEDLTLLDWFEEHCEHVEVCTEDGSAGEKGLVTAPLTAHLDRDPARPRTIYACGPEPMLRAVRGLALERGVEAQLSLEEHMACGFGVCLGCVVPVRGAENEYGRFRRCCVEGPVFTAEELDW